LTTVIFFFYLERTIGFQQPHACPRRRRRRHRHAELLQLLSPSPSCESATSILAGFTEEEADSPDPSASCCFALLYPPFA
ncbi:Os05g0414800, partial [Oryza sativa Japonica Group]